MVLERENCGVLLRRIGAGERFGDEWDCLDVESELMSEENAKAYIFIIICLFLLVTWLEPAT